MKIALQEIHSARSTNGRWGMSIIGPEGCSLSNPQEGRLDSLGNIAGVETFQFHPQGGTGRWFMLSGDLEVVAGAEIIRRDSLQSDDYYTVIVGGNFFAVQSFGYKRRSSELRCFNQGQLIDVPSPVLAALGVIPCEREEVKVQPPPLETTLSAALKAAGLA